MSTSLFGTFVTGLSFDSYLPGCVIVIGKMIGKFQAGTEIGAINGDCMKFLIFGTSSGALAWLC